MEGFGSSKKEDVGEANEMHEEVKINEKDGYNMEHGPTHVNTDNYYDFESEILVNQTDVVCGDGLNIDHVVGHDKGLSECNINIKQALGHAAQTVGKQGCGWQRKNRNNSVGNNNIQDTIANKSQQVENMFNRELEASKTRKERREMSPNSLTRSGEDRLKKKRKSSQDIGTAEDTGIQMRLGL